MAEYKTLVKKIPVSPDKKTKQKDYLKKGRLPIVDQGQSLVGGYTDDADMAVKCELPVIVFGDHTRAVKYITFPFGAGADGIKVLQPKENILPPFLYYGTQYIVAKMPDRGYARHYQYVEKEDLPVPSLPEQERIVARIEELFSQLDAGVETLKKTKAQLAVYRQAVLKEAFSDCDDSVTMGSVATMIDPQPSHRTPPEFENGIPYIGIGDIDYNGKTIRFKNARKVNPSVYEDHLQRYTLRDGDFVMGKIGTIGKPFRLPLPQNYTLSANVILIQPDAGKINPEYLFWQFSSPQITEQLMAGKNETSQPAFGIQKARLLRIKMCSPKDQYRIVYSIREKISVCENIEQTVTLSLQQAEAMRQRILKDAFEGKLT